MQHIAPHERLDSTRRTLLARLIVLRSQAPFPCDAGELARRCSEIASLRRQLLSSVPSAAQAATGVHGSRNRSQRPFWPSRIFTSLSFAVARACAIGSLMISMRARNPRLAR